MIALLLQVLVVVIVIGVLYWALHRLWSVFGLPPTILAILDILLVVGAVFWGLRVFGLL